MRKFKVIEHENAIDMGTDLPRLLISVDRNHKVSFIECLNSEKADPGILEYAEEDFSTEEWVVEDKEPGIYTIDYTVSGWKDEWTGEYESEPDLINWKQEGYCNDKI
jgi:hypothetical protein